MVSLVVVWCPAGPLLTEVPEEIGERSPHMWADPVRHKHYFVKSFFCFFTKWTQTFLWSYLRRPGPAGTFRIARLNPASLSVPREVPSYVSGLPCPSAPAHHVTECC